MENEWKKGRDVEYNYVFFCRKFFIVVGKLFLFVFFGVDISIVLVFCEYLNLNIYIVFLRFSFFGIKGLRKVNLVLRIFGFRICWFIVLYFVYCWGN